MPKLALPYEIKPYVITQEWGVHRPDFYRQYGFDDHNGQDVALPPDKEIRAPFDFEVTQILWQPSGGGLVLGIVSQSEYEGPGKEPCVVQVDFMHLHETKVKVGYKGKMGELVAIGNNSGVTTGPHCHIRHKWMKRVGSRLKDAEKNSAQNTFDPTKYRTGDYAKDLHLLTLKVSLLSAVLTLLRLKRGV
jgi:murein DD-endopeptidase MepM/ murein hydrolase activator NlpD